MGELERGRGRESERRRKMESWREGGRGRESERGRETGEREMIYLLDLLEIIT